MNPADTSKYGVAGDGFLLVGLLGHTQGFDGRCRRMWWLQLPRGYFFKIRSWESDSNYTGKSSCMITFLVLGKSDEICSEQGVILNEITE